MRRSRGLMLLGLGALAIWALWPRDERPEPTPGATGPLDRPGTAGRAPADRPVLPTRTRADPPSRAPAPEPPADLPPQEPDSRPHVTCRLSERLPATSGALYLDTDHRYLVGQVTAMDDRVSFPIGRDAGAQVLHLVGFEPVQVSWTSQGGRATCTPDPLVLSARQPMTLGGRVLNTAGNPELDARVLGCGPVRMAHDGAFTVSPVSAPCTLQAVRQDGYWFSRSQREEIAYAPGRSVQVDLVLNEYPRGGMGIAVSMTDQGIRVTDVHPDTPAAQAGLQAGDVILTVDGIATVDLGLREFVSQATGEAGTDVQVTVLDAHGGERAITLTRAMLGP